MVNTLFSSFYTVSDCVFRLEDFLVPELQANEEEKIKLDSGLTNGAKEPKDQDLSVLPTKCVSSIESLEIRSVRCDWRWIWRPLMTQIFF